MVQKSHDVVSTNDLIFPHDAHDGTFFPETIKFSIYHNEGASYKAVRDAGIALAGNAKSLGDELKVAGNALKDQANADKASGNAKDENGKRISPALLDEVAGEQAGIIVARGEKILDGGLNLGKVFTTQAGDSVKKTAAAEKTRQKLLQIVYLNMPGSVVFNESVEWQGSDLGALGALKATGEAGAAAEVGILGNAGAILGGAAGAVTSAVPGISGIAGTVIGAVAGAGSIQSAGEATFRVKANPYKEQTFQGVGFRSFDYSFILRARNFDEVETIRDIITTFRAHSKPTFENGKGDSGVFAYPKEFRIEYLTLNEDDDYVTNPYLPEIKYCVCTAVNTNYTAQGWRSFEGGAPVDISLQLTFQETEIITSEDVMGNTSTGRFRELKRKF